MELQSGEQSKELLDAQAHIYNHICNFINSMSLKCAVQLGIPDIIHKHGKPMTLSELIDVLPVNEAKAHGVYRLMRILIHSGFFTEEKVDESEETHIGYWLTPASRLLLKDEPWSMMPLVLFPLDPVMIGPWHHLCEWFKNEHVTPFEAKHGVTIWEYIEKEPRFNSIFNEAMASDTRFFTSVLMRDCKHVFEGLTSIVDVGGGTGTMSTVIANALPNMKCTVLDLPHVVDGLEGTTKNLRYVGGDMFESIPSADAVLLKWILHDWSDERCIKILKNCKEAVSSSDRGKVVIIDMIVNDKESDDKAIETQLFFDMHMMVVLEGRERNENEWKKMFYDAGFGDYKIISTLGTLKSVIEVYP